MIDKQLLFKTVEQAIEGTSIFIVDIRINPGNAVVVEIDSFDSVDIETCASITR